jgi:hypothetical protein
VVSNPIPAAKDVFLVVALVAVAQPVFLWQLWHFSLKSLPQVPMQCHKCQSLCCGGGGSDGFCAERNDVLQ